ncbi:MAG: DUF4065 domain-containing protein [Nitrospira sp. SB0677_bin_15]|nr:DUF4065 domain-containing protein [Nitrospira sp. SB0677_bin_15]
MGYTAKAIANYFLAHYGKKGISPLKLQKLIYIAHGWHLAIQEKPLVDDEFAEAWQFGPVFPSIYHEFKSFGSNPIPANERAKELRSDFNQEPPVFTWETPMIRENDKETPALLDRVWEVYSKYTASELSALTHQEGTPWHTVWNENPGMKNMHIENDEIKKYYKRLSEQRNDNGET